MSKRGNGEGSIFRYGKRWRVSISIPGPSGKRVRRTKTVATRADAIAALQAMRQDATKPRPAENMTTVSQWLTSWLATQKPMWAANTHSIYESAVEKWIRGRIGHQRIVTLSTVDVRNLLSETAQDGAGVRTQQLIRETLMSACNAAVRDGVLVANPVLNVGKPKASKRPDIVPFTEEEVREILKATAGHRYHVAMVLMFSLGLRLGETLGLKWSHIDLELRTLRVQEQLIEIKGILSRTDPKTASSRRTLNLPESAVEAITAHKAIALKAGMIGREEILFARDLGPVRRTNFANRFWRPLLKKLNLKHRGIHHTRHTFATLALRRGVPLRVVSAVLGHSTPETTLRVYAHFLPDDLSMAAQAMDDVISGKPSGSPVAIAKTSKTT
jgi:integrase